MLLSSSPTRIFIPLPFIEILAEVESEDLVDMDYETDEQAEEEYDNEPEA